MKIALSSLCFHLLDDITLLLSVVVDVFVHRLLAASLGIYKLPTVFQDRPQLTSVADSKSSLTPSELLQGFIIFKHFECSDKICKHTSLFSLPDVFWNLRSCFAISSWEIRRKCLKFNCSFFS